MCRAVKILLENKFISSKPKFMEDHRDQGHRREGKLANNLDHNSLNSRKWDSHFFKGEAASPQTCETPAHIHKACIIVSSLCSQIRQLIEVSTFLN